MQVTFGKMEIAGGLFQIVMAQQNLNGVQVGAGFQHVRGEAVAEYVGIHLLLASPHGERRTGRRDAAFWYRWADHHYASCFRGKAKWIFCASAASVNGVPRAERD